MLRRSDLSRIYREGGKHPRPVINTKMLKDGSILRTSGYGTLWFCGIAPLSFMAYGLKVWLDGDPGWQLCGSLDDNTSDKKDWLGGKTPEKIKKEDWLFLFDDNITHLKPQTKRNPYNSNEWLGGKVPQEVKEEDWLGWPVNWSPLSKCYIFRKVSPSWVYLGAARVPKPGNSPEILLHEGSRILSGPAYETHFLGTWARSIPLSFIHRVLHDGYGWKVEKKESGERWSMTRFDKSLGKVLRKTIYLSNAFRRLDRLVLSISFTLRNKDKK